MIEYIIAFFAGLGVYKHIKFFLIRKKIKGPGKIVKGAETFFYKKGKTGALLLHGFTGSPQEFTGLAKFLSKKNITCYCPLLPGHGTSPERLSVVNWYEWIEEVNASLDFLKNSCDKIYLIGNSFGGNLAVYAASNNPDIKGLIVMGMPIKFRRERLLKSLFLLLRTVKIFQKKYYPKNYRNNPYLKKQFCYTHIPLKSIPQILKVIKLSRKRLRKIKTPLFVINSEKDSYISEESTEIIKKETNSKIKKIFWVPESYHSVLSDKNKDLVIKEIYKFIKKN